MRGARLPSSSARCFALATVFVAVTSTRCVFRTSRGNAGPDSSAAPAPCSSSRRESTSSGWTKSKLTQYGIYLKDLATATWACSAGRQQAGPRRAVGAAQEHHPG